MSAVERHTTLARQEMPFFLIEPLTTGGTNGGLFPCRLEDYPVVVSLIIDLTRAHLHLCVISDNNRNGVSVYLLLAPLRLPDQSDS